VTVLDIDLYHHPPSIDIICWFSFEPFRFSDYKWFGKFQFLDSPLSFRHSSSSCSSLIWRRWISWWWWIYCIAINTCCSSTSSRCSVASSCITSFTCCAFACSCITGCSLTSCAFSPECSAGRFALDIPKTRYCYWFRGCCCTSVGMYISLGSRRADFISKMYFSHWKPPGVFERMWSVTLDPTISGEYQTLGGHSCRPSK